MGAILQAPESVSSPVGGIAEFTCAGIGSLVWEVNDSPVFTPDQAQDLAMMGIFVPPPISPATVRVDPVTLSLNGTSFRCLVADPVAPVILNSSEVVYLFVLLGESVYYTVDVLC